MRGKSTLRRATNPWRTALHCRAVDCSKYILRGRRRSSQGWKTFPRNHSDGIAAVDFLVVPTLSFERLFRLSYSASAEETSYGSASPRIRQYNGWPTGSPKPWDTAPAFLIRDNDCAYSVVFTRRVQSMGIRDRPIAPRSPRQNRHVERAIGVLAAGSAPTA